MKDNAWPYCEECDEFGLCQPETAKAFTEMMNDLESGAPREGKSED